MINVAIVDDHTLFRQGILLMLERYPKYKVIGDFGSAQEVMTFLKESKVLPDIMLLDISLPDHSGFEVAKAIKRKYKGIRIVILSMHEEMAYRSKALKLGCYAYLIKSTEEEDLIFALDEVSKGKKHFSEMDSFKVIEFIGMEEDLQQPSRREIEVLAMVADGFTTKEISTKLFISNRTVDTHRNNLMKKLNVQNTAELIKKAHQFKII